MHPVVFLDIDGVLNVPPDKPQTLRKSCVDALNWLTDAADAQIVLSSTWRRMPGVEGVLIEQGIQGKIIGKTPEHHGQPRGYEIRRWFKTHVYRRCIILDDDNDMLEFSSRLVQTDPLIGLTRPLSELAFKLLRR